MAVSQADFTAWLRLYPQWTPAQLPDNSQFITDAYNYAIETVNAQIAAVAPDSYRLAAYCLGASYLINWAQDQSGQTLFASLRDTYKINSFQGGVVSGTSDEGTSVTLAVPESLQSLNVGDLMELKDPWGRQYIAIAQRVGSVWGLTGVC